MTNELTHSNGMQIKIQREDGTECMQRRLGLGHDMAENIEKETKHLFPSAWKHQEKQLSSTSASSTVCLLAGYYSATRCLYGLYRVSCRVWSVINKGGKV
ncbi:unnamed protein product [Natator depressus]